MMRTLDGMGSDGATNIKDHGNARPATALALLPLALLLLLITACNGKNGNNPAPPFPQITLTPLAIGLVEPVSITNAGDASGRLFVVERSGTIRIIKNGSIIATPFLDLTSAVRSTGGEQGLLGLAFPPGFGTSGRFYVNYTRTFGIGDTVVARHVLTANPDVANPAGETLLTVVQPFANHNGGQLAFGPDGMLYIALGDGGSGGDPSGNAQNLSTHLGKILRIDVESGTAPYAIPTGNPFNNEIWAYGLRNPWRFSFDRVTGDLFIADVGQGLFEEVNFQPAGSPGGENYGWNIMEGLHCFNSATCNRAGLVLPVVEYGHEGGNCSVTGGFVYRGHQYPALRGIYLYADFCSGRIWGLRHTGAGWENSLLLDTDLLISTFGEDEQGNLYLADFGGGGIYKVDAR